ncbi:MAG TPA: toll/interleukin-1 receptor domain-containing protein, partial [Aggregatilineales bacterium]|nr:toll/interleukin-1 receptor domain-containing protein [Aggregatilineales bacterium]
MTHIFISYAREETKSLAINLADKLNAIDGLTVWVDRDIEYGDDWETVIQRQIFKCDYMIVFYSPGINRHIYDELKPKSYVVREIRYAQLHKKTIIPVMIQQTEPPINLIGIQH